MHTILGLVQIGGGRVMDEVEVDAELTARRKAQPGFIEASFPTIAGLWSHLPREFSPMKRFLVVLFFVLEALQFSIEFRIALLSQHISMLT